MISKCGVELPATVESLTSGDSESLLQIRSLTSQGICDVQVQQAAMTTVYMYLKSLQDKLSDALLLQLQRQNLPTAVVKP